VARRTVHHIDLQTLVDINKGVVALTGEPHAYSPADGEKLAALVTEVEQRANNQEPEEAVPEKAALLVFKVASGQYFRAGNKRTALLAGLVFLAKNGYKFDITDPEFVSTVDKVGIAAASLDDLYEAVRRLAMKSKAERRSWDKVVGSTLDSMKDFLTSQAA
jgi:death-on-curing family protein